MSKFFLMLQKGVCPYEYMDKWERSDEMSLSDKKIIYSNLTKKDIRDADYKPAKKKSGNVSEYKIYVSITI